MDIAGQRDPVRTIITSFTVFLTALALFIWAARFSATSRSRCWSARCSAPTRRVRGKRHGARLWIALDRRKGIQAE